MICLSYRSILVLALGTLVTGCITTAEQQAQRNEERCAARGYQPNTDQLKDCVVRLESERSQRMESNRRYQLEKSDNPTTANRGF
jgi:3-phenylpropionate/cinnamic acid dioxygenase small subunit